MSRDSLSEKIVIEVKEIKTVLETTYFGMIIPHPTTTTTTQKRKLFFMVILENIVVFPSPKKLIREKYLEPHFLQKKLYRFMSPDIPFPSNQPCLPTNGFSQFFF